MGPQALGLRTLLHFLLDRLTSVAWIVGFSRSSNSSRSCRRRLAHGANQNDSSCSRPFSRHNLFLHRTPSFRATACSWFMMRVRACTMRGRCPAVAADRDFLTRYPDLWKSSFSMNLEDAVDPGDLSSACVRASWRSRWRPRSTAQLELEEQSFKPARCPLASIPMRTFIPCAARSR